MNKYDKEIKEMRKFAKEVSSSKKKSIRFLRDAGICTATGKLTKFYK